MGGGGEGKGGGGQSKEITTVLLTVSQSFSVGMQQMFINHAKRILLNWLLFSFKNGLIIDTTHSVLHFDTSLNDPDPCFKSQVYEEAKSSVLIFSHISQVIWMNCSLLL